MGNDDWKNAKSVYDFTVKNNKGEDVSLEKYKGHVLIVVNVASQCGLTKDNYKELVELDEKYRESKGLRILAFPCNQFGGQEPGTNDEICTFASKHGAKFDFFDKIDVNGDNASPLWKYLKHKQGGTLGDAIKWNFSKFIIDKNGQPVERFAPTTTPHQSRSRVRTTPRRAADYFTDRYPQRDGRGNPAPSPSRSGSGNSFVFDDELRSISNHDHGSAESKLVSSLEKLW